MARIKVLHPKKFDSRFLRRNETDVDTMGGTFTLNERTCTCKRCGEKLESGQAVKHMSTTNGWHFRRFYLCLICTISIRQHTLIMSNISPVEFNEQVEKLREKLGISREEVQQGIDERFEYATKN